MILNREVRVSLVEKVTSEKKLKRGNDHGAGRGGGGVIKEGKDPMGSAVYAGCVQGTAGRPEWLEVKGSKKIREELRSYCSYCSRPCKLH